MTNANDKSYDPIFDTTFPAPAHSDNAADNMQSDPLKNGMTESDAANNKAAADEIITEMQRKRSGGNKSAKKAEASVKKGKDPFKIVLSVAVVILAAVCIMLSVQVANLKKQVNNFDVTYIDKKINELREEIEKSQTELISDIGDAIGEIRGQLSTQPTQ